MTGSPKPLGQDAADKTNRHMESCFHVSVFLSCVSGKNADLRPNLFLPGCRAF